MGRYAKNPIIGDNAFGVTIPNVTTAQRPAGVNGQLIYNTTTSTYQSYIGSAWYNMSTAAGEKTITIFKSGFLLYIFVSIACRMLFRFGA